MKSLSIVGRKAWVCLLAVLVFYEFHGSAATDEWVGTGADNNWGTGANWAAGIVPGNSDNLIFGAGGQPDNVNNLTGLTAGFLTFTNAGFTLAGNPMTLNPATSGIITNTIGINTVSLPLTITPAAEYWSVAANSELRLTGTVVDNAASGTSAGWLCLTNGGVVRIMNHALSARGMDLFQGTVIVDGGLVDATNDGIRFKPPTGSTAAVQITNNGYVRIGGGGNFRLGHNGTGIGGIAGPGSLSEATLSSGTLELYGPATSLLVGDQVAGATGIFNQNGGLVWGSGGSGNALTIGNAANADGTYNLNGGTLWIAAVRQGNASATNAVFNFNGGTLKPTASSTTFLQNLLTANVQNGGAVIDTTNFNITIAQPLLAAGSGGLVKLGAGTLTLSGANTYTGNTIVSNGTLVTGSATFLGGGPLTVTGNGNVYIPFTGSSVAASALNLGSTTNSSLTLDFGSSATAGQNPFLTVGALNGTGAALINVAGTGFLPGTYPLISYNNLSGLASFKLGTLPTGISGALVSSGNALNLVVTLVPKNLEWSAAGNNNWDTSAWNWYDLNNGNNPTNYTQTGGNGDAVTFDDNLQNGGSSVNISTTLTPAQIIVNNNNYAYTFSGTGKISGSTSVTKPNTSGGSLSIDTANDYTGGTLFQGGYLYLGNNQALGTGTLQIDGPATELASDGSLGRTIANAVVLTANATLNTFGDPVNTGTLTLAGPFDFGSFLARDLTVNSDVILAGPILNSGGGGFNTLDGTGQLIITGHGQQGGMILQNGANVIIDGGTWANGDGWRMSALDESSVLFAVTNGGAFFMTNMPTANFRVGYTGDPGANNTLDIAGIVDLWGTAGNGSVVLGQSSATDTLNLRAGGLLTCYGISSAGPAITTANFYGGVLKPIGDNTTFITGLTNAGIWDGLTVDTTNYNVTIAQPLLAAGNGGLTKDGTGTLTLTGGCTYVGPTVINAGKLVLGSAFASPGVITVNTNATLGFQQSAASSPVPVAAVIIGGGTNSALEAELTVSNTPAGYITNLTLNGVVAVNVTGPLTLGRFPLFGYGTIGGAGGLKVGQLPAGTTASLVTNTTAHTVDLLVNGVAQTSWTGTINGNWDTTTTNWLLGGIPAAFSQSANVTFNDAASTSAVNLTETLSPSGVVVSNSALSYQFSGTGSLAGNTGLTKNGTNNLTINTANSFVGNVTINAGKIILGNATALGTAPIYVTNTGTLDINGNAPGLQPVVASGAGVNGAGALINSGPDQNNAYRNVVLTGNTTIGGTGLVGLRTIAASDPGLIAHGFKLTKTGPGQFNLNGGTTVVGLTNVWGTDIGDIDVQQGILSFERRSALGLPNNTITVEAGAALELFALNQSLVPPANKIVLTNGALEGSSVNSGDVNTLAGPIVLNGASNAISSTAGTTLNLNGPLTGAGGATYSGAVILAGSDTYAGPTVIANGTLFLGSGAELAGTTNISIATNGLLDVTAIAPWTLGAGQTLGGSGGVNGSLSVAGALVPTSSTDVLTCYNDLTLGGSTVFYLAKTGGLTNSSIIVNGSLTFGGRLQAVLTDSSTLAVNDTFQLFAFASSPAGAFGAVNLPAGYTWDTTQLAVDGTIKVTGLANRTQPGFTTVTASGGSIIINGTNANGTYVLYSTTNLTLPLNDWTPLATNLFNGSFSLTNAVNLPQQFYRLQ